MGDGKKAETRAELRTKLGLDVLCSAGREDGPAILKDISTLGALLEPASIRPAVGASVTIWLQAEPDEEPYALVTEVVRHTPGGFAVEFRVPYSVVYRFIAKYGNS